MDISVVILTRNSEKYIEQCLTSLITSLRESSYQQYEIFIVDNGSQDRTVAMLKARQHTDPEYIFPIYLERNTGTTYSRNLALKRASGKYICIMDSDVEVSAGAFPPLIEALEENGTVGLVVPKLLYPSGTLQKSHDRFPTLWNKIFRYFFLKLVEKREDSWQQPDEIRHVEYAISAVWVFKHELLSQVGLLDESIFYAPEDVDYCLRIWKAGYSIVYKPTVSCIHHTQEISRGLKINKAFFSHIAGLIYYFRKHKYLFSRPKIHS